MPQLVPFYFINQVTFAFILLIVMIYVFSKYILPRFAFILSLYSYISSELLVYNFFFTNYILPRFAFILSLYNYISSELLVYKFFFTNTPIKNLVTFLFSTHTSKKIFLFIQKKSQKDEIVTIPTKNDIFIFFSWCFYILFVPFFFINMYIFFGTIDIYSISLYNFFSLSFISFSLIYGLSIATLNSLLGNKYNIWKMLRSIMVYYSIFQLILLFLLIIICAFIIINSLIYLLGLSVPDLITWIWLRLSLLPSVIYSLNVLSCLYLKIFSSNNNIKLDFSPFSRNMVKAITFNRFLVCSIGVCSSYSFKSFLISFRCEVCEASLACGEEVSNFRVLISINDWWLGLQSAFKNGWLWLEFTFKKGCLWLQSIFNDLCLYIKNSFVAHCDSGDEDWSHFKDKKGRILKRSRSGSYNSSSGSYNSSSGGYNSEFDPSESNDSRSDSNSSRPTKRIKLEKSEDTIVVEPRIPVSGQSAPQQLAESSMVKAEKNLSNKPLSNKAINKTKSKIKSINKGKGKAKGKAIGQEEIVAHEYNTDFVNTNNGGFTSNENSDLESEEFQAALAESRAYEQRRIAGLQGGSIAESSRMGAMRNRSFRIAESQGGSIAESSRMGAMRNRSFRIAESSNTIESSRQEDIGSSGEKDVDDEWLPSKKGKSVKAKAKAKGKGKAPAIKSDSSGSDSADSDNSDSASNGPSSNKKIKLEESEDRKIKLEESEDTIVVQLPTEESEDTIVVQLPTEESEDTRVVEPRISVLGQSAQRQLSTTEANRARKAAYQRERRKNLKDSMTEEQKKAKNAEAAKAKERYKNMSEEQKQARKAKIAELKDSMSEEQKKDKNAAEAAKARERYKNMTEEQKQAKKAKNAAWVEKAKVSITEEEKAARVEKIKERRKSLKDSMSEEQKKAKNAAEAAKAKERYKNMSEEQKQAKKAKNAELKDSMSEEQKQAKNAAKAARAREWYKNRTEEQKATKKNSWEEWFKKRKLHMTEEEREASSSSSLQDSDSDRT